MFMDPDHLTTLSELYDESCREVFETLSGDFSKVEHVESVPSSYSAHIGAISDDINLVIVLKGPLAFLEETHPQKHEFDEIDSVKLMDWISELANRFMGSLKNGLIPYEHTLSLGVPQTELSALQQDRLQTEYVPLSRFYDSQFGVFESNLFVKILNKDIHFSFNESLAAEACGVDDGELEFF